MEPLVVSPSHLWELGFHWRDLLAAVVEMASVVSGAMLVLAYGMALLPGAIGYGIGIIGSAITGNIAPISFQQETIVLAGDIGQSVRQRLLIIIGGGLIAIILGSLGALTAIINFVGEPVFYGMMAGVGIYLANAGLSQARGSWQSNVIGASTVLVAVFIYLVFNDLMFAIGGSVLTGILMGRFIPYKSALESGKCKEEERLDPQKLHFFLPKAKEFFSPMVVRGIFAITTLQIGGNIAYGKLTSSFGNYDMNPDTLTVISGVADVSSAIFGGGPVESIVSVTGGSPNPLLSGILLMIIATILIVTGAFSKFAKYFPMSAMAGFLFVLGVFGCFIPNISLGVAGDPVVSAVTVAVTALVDPFTGMVAGVIVKYLLMMATGI